MLSTCYESIEVDQRIWLHLPSGAFGLQEMTLNKKFQKKGRDLTQSYDINPYTQREIQKTTWLHKNATKNFDYKTNAGRLWRVSSSNKNYPNGVVKPVNGYPTFPLTAKAMSSKGHTFKIL